MIRQTWIVVAVALMLAVPALAEETAAPEQEAQPNEIVVEFVGLKSDEGQIGCRIFSKPDGFPDKMKKADEQLYGKIKSKSASCVFKGYKPGTYAISVMHDLNSSGDLDTSFVGRPKEPWGVSNDAPPHRFSAPTFDECSFKYEGGKKLMKVKLQ